MQRWDILTSLVSVLAVELVLGALLQEAEVAMAVLPLLASEGAQGGLGLDGLGHIAVQVVDVIDTGDEGSNSVLLIQASLTLLHLGDTVLAVVAREGLVNARLGGAAEVLGPGGSGGSGGVSGHCD